MSRLVLLGSRKTIVSYSRGVTYISGRGITLEVGLNRLILLIEEGQIGNEILDDVGVRQRVDARFLGGVGRDTA